MGLNWPLGTLWLCVAKPRRPCPQQGYRTKVQPRVVSSRPCSRGARLHMGRLPGLYPTLPHFSPRTSPFFLNHALFLIVGHNVKMKQAKKNKFIFLSKEIN